MRAASGPILLGSVTGFAVALALTPVIARLVAPAEYGQFAILVALSSIWVGVSTMRLEVVAQGQPEATAGRLAALATSLVMALSVLLTVLAAICAAFGITDWALVVVGPLVGAASLQLLATAALVRQARYRTLGSLHLIQGAGTAVVQVALLAWSPSVTSLVIGFVLGRLPWLAFIPAPAWRATALVSARTDLRRAAPAGLSALVNSVAGQVVILAPALALGSPEAAVFAMAVRLLIAPLSVVGQGVAAASLGELGRSVRDGDPRLHAGVKRTIATLALLGAVPCVAVLFLGPALAPVALGEQWRDVGVVLAWLSVGAWFQFSAAPLAQLLNLLGHSTRLLAWDVCRLCCYALAMVVPALLIGETWVVAATYSAALIVVYVALTLIVLTASRSWSHQRAQNPVVM